MTIDHEQIMYVPERLKQVCPAEIKQFAEKVADDPRTSEVTVAFDANFNPIDGEMPIVTVSGTLLGGYVEEVFSVRRGLLVQNG